MPAEAALDASEMYWIEVLWYLCVPGAFGGILAVLRPVAIGLGMDLDVADGLRRHHGVRVPSISALCWRMILGALAGIGGSLAFVGVLALDGKFRAAPQNEDILLFCSAGVISGFLGFKLLVRLSNNLEEQLRHLADRQAAKEATDVEQTLRIKEQSLRLAVSNGYYVANSLREDAPERSDPEAVEDAIKVLEEARSAHRSHRPAAMILGRLYRARNDEAADDLLKGIEVLTDALAAKSAEGTGEDKDAADILYNRACYYALLFAKDGNQANKNSCLSDLEKSVKLLPKNAQHAKEDSDFDPVKESEKFKSLIGE